MLASLCLMFHLVYHFSFGGPFGSYLSFCPSAYCLEVVCLPASSTWHGLGLSNEPQYLHFWACFGSVACCYDWLWLFQCFLGIVCIWDGYVFLLLLMIFKSLSPFNLSTMAVWDLWASIHYAHISKSWLFINVLVSFMVLSSIITDAIIISSLSLL